MAEGGLTYVPFIGPIAGFFGKLFGGGGGGGTVHGVATTPPTAPILQSSRGQPPPAQPDPILAALPPGPPGTQVPQQQQQADRTELYARFGLLLREYLCRAGVLKGAWCFGQPPGPIIYSYGLPGTTRGVMPNQGTDLPRVPGQGPLGQFYDQAISEGCGREFLRGQRTTFCETICGAADFAFQEQGHCERIAREAIAAEQQLAATGCDSPWYNAPARPDWGPKPPAWVREMYCCRPACGCGGCNCGGN